MADLCSYSKDLINSWIDEAQKMVTNLLSRIRRKPSFSDHDNMNSEIHSHFNEGAGNYCSTLEGANRLWCDELPNEILAEIISSMDNPKDYLHSIGVCRRWRSIAHSLKSNPGSDHQLFHPLPRKYPLPMLLLPACGKRIKLHYFYSITKKKVHKLHVPEIRNKWICGSWRGWLATVDIKDKNLIYLLNPITKVTIPLPPLPPVPTVPWAIIPEPVIRFSWNIRKIIIVTSEEVAKQSSSCTIGTVVVLLTGGGLLHICRIGDDKWTVINTYRCYIRDVIEFKGHLYFVDDNAYLFAIDETNNRFTKVTLIKSFPEMLNWGTHYLAQSSGHLLVITRCISHVTGQTLGFVVHRLEEESQGKIWKKLGNLHDQAIFVGCNRTLCLDSYLYPECHGNCIYFADEQDMIVRTPVGPLMNFQDNGVYHMNDRKIEPLLEGMNGLRFPAIWFSPNPW